MTDKITRTHKTRYVPLGKAETARLCVCGEPCRPHTFFCGDVCRFWSKVNKGPHCWTWAASTCADGRYGQFSIDVNGNRRVVGAHQFSYALAHGALPDGHEVRHSCHNGLCVRPDHLLSGTHGDNVRDSAEAGRLHKARPNAHRITAEQVHEIRELVNSGQLQYRVAERFGITKGFVSQIMAGTRRHFDAPFGHSIEKAS